MRFIDNSGLKGPDGWDAAAADAKKKVVIDGEEVNLFGAIWRALKDNLAQLSNDKCWYCEKIQERSDNAVDHYRPKSIYKWLAFSKGNFCYSCTYCNSRRTDIETGVTGGKGDQFPLINEAQRAKSDGEEANEQPILLNPCFANDTMLLDFLADGTPTARFPTHQTKKIRAETSIRLYHLNHSDLIETRRRMALNLNSKIDIANALYDRVDMGDLTLDSSYNDHVRELKNAMSEKAELSTFARKIVMGRREILWIDSLIQTN